MEVFKIKSPDGPLTKIMIRSKCETLFYKLSDIVYCKADRNYTCFYTVKGNKCLCCMNLSRITEKLEKLGFYKVNKSYLVNIIHIISITSGEKYTLKLANGAEIKITAPKKAILEFLLNNK